MQHEEIMTTSYKLEHEFPEIPFEVFEKHLNHPELNKMLAKMPSFKSRDLIDSKTLKNGEQHWCFKVVAGGELPPAISKIVSPDTFTWLEKSRFVPKEHAVYFEIEPLAAKGKFESAGKWSHKKHNHGTLRVLEGEMTVKIPFVGKMVENFLLNEFKRNYEIEPGIQKEFYQKIMQSEK